MRYGDIAKGVISTVLGRKVTRVKYKNTQQYERSWLESKSIIMDAYFEDSDTYYNIEISVFNFPLFRALFTFFLCLSLVFTLI